MRRGAHAHDPISRIKSAKQIYTWINTAKIIVGDDNIELKLTSKGLKRLRPHTIWQAVSLSPHILRRVRGLLDLAVPFDATLWALLLLAFFTLSRKSNLVVMGQKAFDKISQLCRLDVLIGENGLLVQCKWSKTNQFGSRALLVPVLAIPASVWVHKIHTSVHFLCKLYWRFALTRSAPGF